MSMHSRAITTGIVWWVANDTYLHCGWRSCLGSGIQFVRFVWMEVGLMEWVVPLGDEKWVWAQGA